MYNKNSVREQIDDFKIILNLKYIYFIIKCTTFKRKILDNLLQKSYVLFDYMIVLTFMTHIHINYIFTINILLSTLFTKNNGTF